MCICAHCKWDAGVNEHEVDWINVMIPSKYITSWRVTGHVHAILGKFWRTPVHLHFRVYLSVTQLMCEAMHVRICKYTQQDMSDM